MHSEVLQAWQFVAGVWSWMMITPVIDHGTGPLVDLTYGKLALFVLCVDIVLNLLHRIFDFTE